VPRGCGAQTTRALCAPRCCRLWHLRAAAAATAYRAAAAPLPLTRLCRVAYCCVLRRAPLRNAAAALRAAATNNTTLQYHGRLPSRLRRLFILAYTTWTAYATYLPNACNNTTIHQPPACAAYYAHSRLTVAVPQQRGDRRHHAARSSCEPRCCLCLFSPRAHVAATTQQHAFRLNNVPAAQRGVLDRAGTRAVRSL